MIEVLVVDDDPEIRDLVGREVEQQGWRFVPARDDGECVRVWALKTIHFQLRTRS